MFDEVLIDFDSASLVREDSEQDQLLRLMGKLAEDNGELHHSGASKATERSGLRSKSPGRIEISPSSVSFHEDSFCVISERRSQSPGPDGYAMGRTASEAEEINAHSRTWKQQGV